MENSYVRIGTSYYKHVERPLLNGTTSKSLILWSIECIKHDHQNDKVFLASIPKFDGFCCFPEHLNYQREIKNFYNNYQPLNYVSKAGQPTKTLMFLKHIFGEQLSIGLDYLKILLIHPTQILPILSLVSTERNTGKTTFLNYLKAVYGDNATINSNEDFKSNFNISYITKLLICVDEVYLNSKEDSEKIKVLSTSKHFKSEGKGIEKMEVEYYGKIILCSNREYDFVKIDESEVRYWVRKINPIINDNHNLLQELIEEIPFIINYLIELPFSTQKTTRMWFTPKQLLTTALIKVKLYNKNTLQVEMAQSLLSILDSNDDISEICFSLTDIQQWLQKKGIKGNDNMKLKRVLQFEWKLSPSSNSNAYLQYNFGIDSNILMKPSKGRYYKVSKIEVLKYNNLHFDEKEI